MSARIHHDHRTISKHIHLMIRMLHLLKIPQNHLRRTSQSAYLVICSSGGVPATSALGSEAVLSAGTPADAVGEVAAVVE